MLFFQVKKFFSSSSLKQKIKESANFEKFKINWLQDKSTYPIIGIMTIASTSAFVFGVNFLLNEPDVMINKEKRKQMIQNNYEEGKRWKENLLHRLFDKK